MTTGAAFLGEKCFVWQWRLVDLSYFAYHKCIHLNVDVEWSIWNTFEIAGIFWEGFLLLATLIDPLVCFHPSTGSPQHQWRDPHPGPSKASLQRRWQIIPSVASGVLSRKKMLVPKRRVFDRCFRYFFSPRPYFSEFCLEDILKTGWRLLEHKSSLTISFRNYWSGWGMCVLSSWMMNLEGGCSLWLFHGEKVE